MGMTAIWMTMKTIEDWIWTRREVWHERLRELDWRASGQTRPGGGRDSFAAGGPAATE
jgi:hypothetical protein